MSPNINHSGHFPWCLVGGVKFKWVKPAFLASNVFFCFSKLESRAISLQATETTAVRWDGAQAAPWEQRGVSTHAGRCSSHMPRADVAQNITSTGAHTAPAAEQLFLLRWKPGGRQSSCQHCTDRWSPYKSHNNPEQWIWKRQHRPQHRLKCSCELLHTPAGQKGEGLTQQSNQGCSRSAPDPAHHPADAGPAQSRDPSLCAFHPAPTALLPLSCSHPPTNRYSSPQSLLLIFLLTAWMQPQWGFQYSHLIAGLIFMSSNDW